MVPLLTVGIWFRNGNLLGTAEGGIPFNNLNRHAEIFKYSWAETAVGNATSFTTASYPTYQLLSLFESANVAPFLIEAFVFWFILVTSGVGIFLLGKKTVGLSDSFAFVAVVFYWTCPFILINIWSRFLYNHMFFLSLLPLAVYVYIKGIQDRKYSHALIVSLLCLFYSYALTALALTSLIFGFLFSILFYFLIFEKKKQNILFYVYYFLIFVLSFVTLNFWWITQAFTFFKSTNYIQVVGEFFSSQGNLDGLTVLSQKLGNFIDVSRFMHYSFYYEEATRWSSIYTSKIALFFSSVILLIILLGIYTGRRNKNLTLFSLVFLASLFLAKGNNPPFGELYTYLFIKIPFLQFFRNPFEKIGILTVLSGALLFSYALQRAVNLMPDKKNIFINFYRQFLNIAPVFIICLFWGFPFFSGIVFETINNPFGRSSTYEVEVPNYYDQIDSELTKEQTTNRFLALPLLGEGITHSWTTPYRGVDLYSTIFSKPGISFNTTIPFYEQVISHLTKNQLSQEVIKFIPFLAVDKIILREDIDFKERLYPNPLFTAQNLNDLENRGFLSFDKKYGQLSSYDINPKLNWGKFYITPNIIFTDEKDFSKLVDSTTDLMNNKSVYVPSEFYDDLNNQQSSIYLYPNEVRRYYLLPQFQKLTNQNLQAKLFYVRHYPDNLAYPLVRSKELFTSFLYFEYPKWVLYQTNLLGKRAVEICNYNPVDAQAKSKNELIEQYKVEYNNFKDEIEEVVKQKRPFHSDIINYLVIQAILLNRCSDIELTFYQELFVNLEIIPTSSDEISFNQTLVEYFYNFPASLNYTFDGLTNQGKFNGQVLTPNNGKSSFVDTRDKNQLWVEKGKKSLIFNEKNAYISTPIFSQNEIILNENTDFDIEIPFDDYDSEYLIEFDYQTLVGDFFGLFVKQDNDNDFNLRYFQGIELNKKSTNYKVAITPSVGSSYASVGFTGDKNKLCFKECETHSNNLSAIIQNLRITKKQPIAPTFSKSGEKIKTESKLTWQQISPVLYELYLEKSNNDPEFLVFSELFSGGWVIQDDNGKAISDKEHYLVNGYANGWILKTPGEYRFTVTYLPEKILTIGKYISIISLGSILIIITLLIRKYEKR